MYTLYLDGVAFPVAPEKLEIKVRGRNETIDLVNDAEVSIVKAPGLTEYAMTVLLPNQQYGFAYYPEGFRRARYYTDKLEALLLGKKPFSFILTRTLAEGTPLSATKQTVTLEEYTLTEETGQGFDMKAKLSLKEWRQYGAVLAALQGDTAVAGSGRRAGEPERPASYVVRRGDTLYNIAHKFYGDGSRYKELAALNQLADPNVIEPGQVIRLA